MAMQKGTIQINGRYWTLRVWENTKEGRKKTGHKLGLVSENRPTANGNPPQNIQAAGDAIVAKINLNESRNQTATTESLKSYIERYIEKGLCATNNEPASKNTLKAWRQYLNLIEDFLPNIQLRNVRTPDVNKILRDLKTEDGEDVRADQTYKNIRNLLSGVFHTAVGEGACDFNPVREATIPKGAPSDTYGYSLEETHNIHNLFDTLAKDKDEVTAKAAAVAKSAVMVLSFTGLRKGELRGIRWEDYDTKAGLLHVRRAVEGSEVKETKTEASTASIPLIGVVRDALNTQLAQNSGTGYVFHNATNAEPLNLDHFGGDFLVPKLEEAGIAWHGYHAFRRGLNQSMEALGVDESLRKRIMRHAFQDVTAKFYGRKQPLNLMREALEQVEAAYNDPRIRMKLHKND